MNDFFAALKADLTDRRIRPIALLALVALLGAGAYVALGGGGSSSTPTAAAIAPGTPATSATGIAASVSVPNTATAETTEGEASQHHGVAHNPFAQLPQAKVVIKATTSTSSGSSSSGSSGSSTTETKGSSEGSSGGSTSTETKPAKHEGPKTIYNVGVLFGLTPPPPPAPSTPLTPYENLKLLEALPSDKSPLVVFRGVTSQGKSATFTLVSEAILHGVGACLPNASQCQEIDLKPGQSEQFEYFGTEGQIISYELTVVSIAAEKASAASVEKMVGAASKPGRELLRHAGLVAIPGLHASSQAGVLVFTSHSAFAARAHAARRAHAGH
jgi:hypothetical protein